MKIAFSRFDLGGGGRLKFSDMVMATASLVLFVFLLDFVLKGIFVLLSSTTIEMLAWIIAVLVASLIVGYVFALKIQGESRIRTVGSIVVLSAFTIMIFVMVWFANPLASPWIKETLENLFDTSGWTNYDWSAFSALAVALDVVLAMIFSFIGLYAGSMLKKTRKT
jgi:hypothetical protein